MFASENVTVGQACYLSLSRGEVKTEGKGFILLAELVLARRRQIISRSGEYLAIVNLCQS